jgi:hypothetical protein
VPRLQILKLSISEQKLQRELELPGRVTYINSADAAETGFSKKKVRSGEAG